MGGVHSSRHIFLVGVKGAGKSAVGKLLARRLHRRFVDLDEEIERLHRDGAGAAATVREIYRLDGGESFRRLEAVACEDAGGSIDALVVATGGGICDNPDAVRSLAGGLVVHLKADPQILFERVMRHGIPAFMRASTESDAEEEFMDLHRRRTGRYEELSDLTVDATDGALQETVDLLVRRIEGYAHGGK